MKFLLMVIGGVLIGIVPLSFQGLMVCIVINSWKEKDWHGVVSWLMLSGLILGIELVGLAAYLENR